MEEDKKIQEVESSSSTSTSLSSLSVLSSANSSPPYPSPSYPSLSITLPSHVSPSNTSPSNALQSNTSSLYGSPSHASPSSSESTSNVSTSNISTSHGSMSHLSTSDASISKTSTSNASTSQAATSNAPTSQASTSNVSTSQALTSQASTSQASTSQASASQVSTSNPSPSTSDDKEFPMPINVMDYKHPLEYTWCWWLHNNFRSRSWEENLINLTSFSTVEDFWCIQNHIKRPSELKFGSDYAIFKEGIRPMWEDVANKDGGKWMILMDRRQSVHEIDSWWLDTVLLMIGENFEHSEEINGAVINVRANKRSKISIWTRDMSEAKKQKILDIGNKWKRELKVPYSISYTTLSSARYLYTV